MKENLEIPGFDKLPKKEREILNKVFNDAADQIIQTADLFTAGILAHQMEDGGEFTKDSIRKLIAGCVLITEMEYPSEEELSLNSRIRKAIILEVIDRLNLIPDEYMNKMKVEINNN